MATTTPRSTSRRPQVTRRDFLKRTGWATAGATALMVGTGRGRPAAQPASPYPDWIPASTKPPKRGGTLTRASAWDPPVIDPRLTQSVGLFQFAGLTEQPPRALRVPRRGDRPHRPQPQGRPGGVVVGEPRPARVDVQAAPGRQVAERAAAQRARARRRRRQVLLRGVRQGRRAVVHLPGDRGHRDAGQAHGARPPQDAQRALRRRTWPSRSTVIFSARGAGGGRRSQEAPDRHRALHPEGAHPQGAGGARSAIPDYFDKGRPYVDEYVILSTPDAATRLAAFRTGPGDFIWRGEPVRGGGGAQDEPRPRRAGATTTRWRRSAWRWRRTSRPSTTCGCAAPSRMAIDRQKQVDTVFEGHGILGWGVPYIYYQDTPPTGEGPRPVVAVSSPAEAKKLLAEAGHPNGFETTLFYYEYFPQMTSQVQLVQQDLKKNLNIDVKITKLDYTTLLRPLRRGQVGRDGVGLPVGPRGRARRAHLPVHALQVDEELLPRQRPASSTS